MSPPKSLLSHTFGKISPKKIHPVQTSKIPINLHKVSQSIQLQAYAENQSILILHRTQSEYSAMSDNTDDRDNHKLPSQPYAVYCNNLPC